MSGSMGDTLANALSSPGISALIGAAQGFGQAALPSRMPVPIGAALGMGLGGALQGQETGQKLQQGEQSLLGARMQNIATGSNLLPMLQTNKLKSDLLSNPAMLQQMMNGGQMPSGLMSSNGVMSGSDYASRVNLGENATGNPAAKNASGPGGTPTSSAVGNGQFLEGTWLPLFKQMYPSQAAGMSDDQILALRTDPAASSAMTQAYAKQNAPVLQQAQIQPTGANLALAHRFGPQGAVGLIGASPDTPVEKILPAAAIAANPTLKGKTAGQVIGSMTMQMGQAPVDFGQGTQVAGPGAGQTGASTDGPQAPQQMAGQQAPSGMVTPGNALVLAQQYEGRANYIDQMNKLGLGFLAPGDPAALRTAAQQFRSIPVESSKALAEMGIKPIVDRYGNMYIGDGQGGLKFLGRGSEVKPVYYPATGQMGWGDVGAVGIGAQPPAGGGPAQAAGGVPPEMALNAQKAALEAQAHAGIAPGLPGVAPTSLAPPAPGMSPSSTSPAGPLGTQGAASVPGTSVPLAPGITAHPLPGGGTALTDTRAGQLDAYKKDMDDTAKLEDELQSTQQAQARTLEMRNVISQLPQTGSQGTQRAAISSFLQTYMPSLASVFTGQSSMLPNATPAGILAKLQLQTAGLQEKEAVGARGGARLTEMYQKANPSLDQVPDVNRQIANLQVVAQQMDLDYGRGLQSYVQKAGNDYLTGKANYLPSQNFDSEWLAQRNPQVYMGSTLAMSGRPFQEWAKGLSSPEIQRALDVVKRIDPTSEIMWTDGHPHVFGQAPQGGSNGR